MIEGVVTANFKYQGSEQEIFLSLKRPPTWKLIVELLHKTFHLPNNCFLYLTYVDDLESGDINEENKTVTVSHDEDLENMWNLMTKTKKLDLGVFLSDANLLKENIPVNHAGRSSCMYRPMVRGKLGGRDESKNHHESYLRAKQCFFQQEKQILITNQEVEQIFNKILHLPEAQQLWKAGCLEILAKKKQDAEENPFVTFEKIISESLTETLTNFTNTLLFKHHHHAEEEEKNAESIFVATQIQHIEMHKSEVRSSLTDSVPLYVSMLEMIPKSAPVQHLVIPKNHKKGDPKPIHIVVPNDFKKEFVLQIKDGKAKLLAQPIEENKENLRQEDRSKISLVESNIFAQSEILAQNNLIESVFIPRNNA